MLDKITLVLAYVLMVILVLMDGHQMANMKEHVEINSKIVHELERQQRIYVKQMNERLDSLAKQSIRALVDLDNRVECLENK